MALQLSIPSDRSAPLRWAATVVFGEMLGLAVDIVEGSGPHLILSGEGRSLTMPSIFPDLQQEKERWGSQIPPLPLAEWDHQLLPEADVEARLPVLFGRPTLDVSESEVRLGVDILGAVFFMLSRFEEVVLPDRDRHDRFPATASLALKGGFLYRPIVDEYVELLWAAMKRLWPGMERKRRQGTVKVSCDVDQPFDRVGRNPMALARAVAADIGKRRNPGLALRRLANFYTHPSGSLRFDPYYTFDRYMDECEAAGRRAAFYFIADHPAGAIDGTYALEESRTLALLRRVAERGHEIGLHGSYNSFRDKLRLHSEREKLAAACRDAGTSVELKGTRQHYLRWDTSQTQDHLQDAGFEYDTSGSYADHPGFRFGTSYPFPMWSWMKQQQLRIIQHPLVLMECSVLSATYLGYGHSAEAWNLMAQLRRAALRRGGDFTFLWHNSELLSGKDWSFFTGLLKSAS